MVQLRLPAKLALGFALRRSQSSGALGNRASPAEEAASVCCRPAGRVQVLLCGKWQDCAPEEQVVLQEALAAGRRKVRVEARGRVYECDLQRMEQVNLATGRARAMRLAPQPAPRAPRAAPGAGSAGAGAGRERAEEAVPRWVRVVVPAGPTFVCGVYRLRAEEANGHPTWEKADGGEGAAHWCIFSTSQGHWAIGARDEASGFGHGMAWVHSPVRHMGVMPHLMPCSWQHNQPEWTTDARIAFCALSEEQALLHTGAGRRVKACRKGVARKHCGAAAGAAIVVATASTLAGESIFNHEDLEDLIVDSGEAVAEFISGLF